MTTPLPAGRGAELVAELLAADDALGAVQREWATLPRTAGGWILQEIRDAYYERLHQAQDGRQEIADRVWAYFEGAECTALEAAAWRLWDVGSRHARARGQP